MSILSIIAGTIYEGNTETESMMCRTKIGYLTLADAVRKTLTETSMIRINGNL
jgi:hypothetical protein